MKRILSALAAAASIAGLALGAAGTANAAGQPPPAKPLFISEVATGTSGFALRDYIEISPSGGPVSFAFDVAVQATFAGQVQQLAVIPAGTIISPGMVYTIAHVASGVGCAQQFFNVDLPSNVPLEVRLVPAPSPLTPVDSAFILQAFQLSPGQSYQRTWLTPATLTPAPETPCVPPATVPDP